MFFFKFVFIYLFMTVLCLCFRSGFSVDLVSWGSSLVVVLGLLTMVPSLVAEPGLQGMWASVSGA